MGCVWTDQLALSLLRTVSRFYKDNDPECIFVQVQNGLTILRKHTCIGVISLGNLSKGMHWENLVNGLCVDRPACALSLLRTVSRFNKDNDSNVYFCTGTEQSDHSTETYMYRSYFVFECHAPTLYKHWLYHN